MQFCTIEFIDTRYLYAFTWALRLEVMKVKKSYTDSKVSVEDDGCINILFQELIRSSYYLDCCQS